MNTRLVFLSQDRERPSSALIVDGAGQIVARGILAPGGAAAPFKGRTVLVVPGTDVATRWIDLDDVPASQAVGEARVLLKDEIGAVGADVHLAVGGSEDGVCAVSIVSRSLMRDFLDRARELGCSPAAVVPDHLMLPTIDEGVLTVARGDTVAVRGHELAFTSEADLASLLIGTRRRAHVEDEQEAERLFAQGQATIPINLLQQDFAPAGRGAFGGWRRAASLAGLAALSPLAIWTAEIVRNEAAARDFAVRAEASARTILADTSSADPVRELRSRIAGFEANDAFMSATGALFEAISRAQDVELERLAYLQDGVIRASLIHGMTSDLGAMRDALEQSGITIREDASEERHGRLVTTIMLSTQS